MTVILSKAPKKSVAEAQFWWEGCVNKPPPSLSLKHITKTGMAYLKKLSESRLLTIQLIERCHGNATDFSDMVQASENVLLDAPIVGSELSWRARNIEAPEFSSVTIDQQGSVGSKEFHDSQIEWLSPTGKNNFLRSTV